VGDAFAEALVAKAAEGVPVIWSKAVASPFDARFCAPAEVSSPRVGGRPG
jgi:hypothetical protein